MNRPRYRSPIAAVSLIALLGTVACSGSTNSTAGTHRQPGTGTATTESTAGAPNPNATESAPPGDIPDNQAFVTYSPSGQGYTVQVPEGWARTSPGQSILFTDKYNSIRIDRLAAARAPTIASATVTEVPAIRAASHGFVPGAVTMVSRKAGTAVEITYRADSPPNPVTGKVIVQAVERYEFWRHGTELVVTLSSSVGSDNVDPWRKVTDSFGWVS